MEGLILIILEKWSKILIFTDLQTKARLFITEGVGWGGGVFGCLPCMSALGPRAVLAAQARSLQSMSRFSTHTNEVNGWLLFSPQFKLPPKCSHDLYTSCCGNQPRAFRQISDSKRVINLYCSNHLSVARSLSLSHTN